MAANLSPRQGIRLRQTLSNKSKARNEYILITNLQKDFFGMCEEMDNYYKELTEEI